MQLFQELVDSNTDNRVQLPSRSMSTPAEAVIIEARVLPGESLFHSLRANAPDISFQLVQNVDQVDLRLRKIAVYNLCDRHCEANVAKEVVQRLRSRLPGFPLLCIVDSTYPELSHSSFNDIGQHAVLAASGVTGIVSALRRIIYAAGEDKMTPYVSRSEARPEALQIETNRLTVRESEILRLVHEGKSNKIIASQMHLSESTVKAHIGNMMRKAGAINRTMLVNKYNGRNKV